MPRKIILTLTVLLIKLLNLDQNIQMESIKVLYFTYNGICTIIQLHLDESSSVDVIRSVCVLQLHILFLCKKQSRMQLLLCFDLCTNTLVFGFALLFCFDSFIFFFQNFLLLDFFLLLCKNKIHYLYTCVYTVTIF